MRVQILQHCSFLFPQQNSTAPSLFLGVTASKTRTFWSIQRTIGKQLVVRPRRSLTMKTHNHILSCHSRTFMFSRCTFHDVLEMRVAALPHRSVFLFPVESSCKTMHQDNGSFLEKLYARMLTLPRDLLHESLGHFGGPMAL